MTEPEQFRRVDDLHVPDEIGAIVYSESRVRLCLYIGNLAPALTVSQARQLRDWLNKALPAETVTVVWTVPTDPEANA